MRWKTWRIGVVVTVFAAVAIQPGAAVAASPAPREPASTAAADYTQRSSARSRDLTGDGLPDILTRQPGLDSGALWGYPNSGTLNGTKTLAPRVEIGRGWNIYNGRRRGNHR
ncbi:FG-GAP repeat domain-containing protein [Amycolatopsis solani]|uniref:FG-GAP repeat domain-containing protein n=1 Tax=Amycolatopsis solani TaxID=3028615 RepID=UPI0025AFE316|nr:VCBS repeat-containing protein [Amycolatopsis sp. MEP2-6]